MNRLFLVLVITTSVTAIDTNLLKYKGLCGSSVKEYDLSQLVRDQRSDETGNDCQQSVGFGFNTQLCPSLGREVHYNSRNFSAFLSDDGQYVYIYLSPAMVYSYSESGQSIGFEFETFGYFTKYADQNYLFVLWLKQKMIDGKNHRYTVDYRQSGRGRKSNISITTQELAMRIDEQLILNDFKTERILTIRSDLTTNITTEMFTIRDSYIILCIRSRTSYYSPKNCRPIDDGQIISCQCHNGGPYYIIAVAITVIWACFVCAALKPIFDQTAESKVENRINYFMNHNCDNKNYRYRYRLTLRLAKLTVDFDLKDVTIDVEFFTQKNESIAPQLRLKAIPLETRPITDIHITMGRLTKMPDIKRIQINHSGKSEGKICLLGVFKKCIHGEKNDPEEWYKVVKTIYRYPRQFHLDADKVGQMVTDAEEMPFKYLIASKLSLPPLDIITFLFIDTLFMGWLSSCFQFQYLASSWALSMMTSLMLTTVAGIVYNFVTIFVYKHLRLTQMKQQMRMDYGHENICSIIIGMFYATISILAIIYTVLIVINYDQESFMSIYRWLAVLLCSASLMAFVWNVSSHTDNIFSQTKPESEMSDLTVNSTSVNENI